MSNNWTEKSANSAYKVRLVYCQLLLMDCSLSYCEAQKCARTKAYLQCKVTAGFHTIKADKERNKSERWRFPNTVLIILMTCQADVHILPHALCNRMLSCQPELNTWGTKQQRCCSWSVTVQGRSCIIMQSSCPVYTSIFRMTILPLNILWPLTSPHLKLNVVQEEKEERRTKKPRTK